MQDLEAILTTIRSRRKSLRPKRVWLPKDKLTNGKFEAIFKELCALYHYRITGSQRFNLKISQPYRQKLDIILRLLTSETQTKGIYLFGGYGTGKTMTLWAMAEMLKLFNQDFSYSLLPSGRIVEVFRQAGEERDYYTLSRIKNERLLIIDDLGSEGNTEISVFGNRQRPIESLLEHRYRLGLWTWITTNYTLSHLAEIYSGYIIDRLRQMFYFLHFDWDSFR